VTSPRADRVVTVETEREMRADLAKGLMLVDEREARRQLLAGMAEARICECCTHYLHAVMGDERVLFALVP